MDVVLACDLGGTSFRAALVDDTGHALALHAIAGAPVQDSAGWSEIDPALWWDQLVEAANALAGAEPALFARIRGIAICGITRTQVFLDCDGQSLRPAITWRDTRAGRDIESLRACLPADHPETAAINPYHPLARLNWLRHAESAVFQALETVLDPKDYLNFRLTGRRASDPISLARLLAAATPGSDGTSLLDAAGIPGKVLPALVEPTDRVGVVLPEHSGALGRLGGVPVFCCANDTWTAVLGLGALKPGVAYNISGTTEVFGVMSAGSATAEGLMSVDWRGLHQLGGPGQNGADTASWLARLLGEPADSASVGTLFTTLLATGRDPQPLLFLPYLQGERTPYWDADLRGAFIGLNRSHRAADLAWAVLEGLAFVNRIVLERAETALGTTVSEIRFGGGASANPVWRQLKADICGRTVMTGEAREPGINGAAAVAWTGLGRFASLADAQQGLVRIAQRHEPDPKRGAIYTTLYSLFRQSEAAIAPVSRSLSALAGQTAHLSGIADLLTGNHAPRHARTMGEGDSHAQ